MSHHALFLIKAIFCIHLVFSTTQCAWRQPPPVDTLVVGLDSGPKTLDPRLTTDANGQRLAKLIFSSLVTIGPDLSPIGDAAKNWQYKDKTYTFFLKSGIRFHNGAPLTTEDILYSFAQFQNAKSPFAPSLKGVRKIEAKYDGQQGWIKIYLKQFTAVLLTDLSNIKLLPKAEVERLGDDFFTQPIGSGAFHLTSQDTNNIHLEAFTDYFAEKSKSKKIHFKIIKDGNTRFQKTYKGKIDIVQSDLPYAKLKVFQRSPRFRLLEQPGLSMTYILLNLRDEVLKERNVRYALFQNLNREDIINYTIEGFAEPATSIMTPGNPFFNDQLKLEVLSDEKLKKLLRRLKNKTLTLKTSNSMKAIENGKIIAQQWRKAGFKVELQSYEWGTFYEDIKKGNFQMATMKWVGATDPDIYRMSLHSKETPPGRNRGYYDNQQLDQLLDQGLSIEDSDQRIRLYKKVQEMVYHDLPTLPLWYEKQFAVVHERVKDYYLPKNGDFSGLLKAFKEAND